MLSVLIFLIVTSRWEKKFFSEIIGVPKSSEAPPCFAKLILYYYEGRWIRNLQKNHLTENVKLCKVFCFINTLNVIIDPGIFKSNFRDVHLEELQMRRENGNNAKIILYDLDIKIKQ